MRSYSRWITRGAALLVLGVALPASAQVEADAVVRGQVLRGDAPLADALVVIHRVDDVEAGAFDSLTAGPDGTFSYRLPRVPDPAGTGEVFFGSVRHQGLLYFGPPIASAAELDSVYRIQAWDTLRAPAGGAPLPLEVRYLLLENDETGWLVTDLLQLRVDGDRTLVPAEEGWTFAYPVPPEAVDPVVAGGDLSPAATTFEDGEVRVSMPLSPGSRQLALTYRLESLALRVPLPGTVDEVELLVREPAPPLLVAGLVATDPITTPDGVSYRRYIGVGLSDATLVLEEGEAPAELPVRELMVAMALLLAGLGAWLIQRRGSPAAAGSAPGVDDLATRRVDAAGSAPPTAADGGVRDRLLLAIASLDEEQAATVDPDRRARIAEERAALVARLRELSRESS